MSTQTKTVTSIVMVRTMDVLSMHIAKGRFLIVASLKLTWVMNMHQEKKYCPW